MDHEKDFRDRSFNRFTCNYFYDYFKEKGMNIYVVGNMSYLNKHIPRIYL